MKDGIYKVVFESNGQRNGQCDGVISIRKNHLNGGDNVFFYRGIINSEGLSLRVTRINPGDTTVMNGIDNVELVLKLNESSFGANFEGHVWSRPDLTVRGSLTFLSDLL